MIKIKTLNTYNDTIINEFLNQSGGKIVNYNPIVIEYDDEKSNFVDPYKGLNAYRVLEGRVEYLTEKTTNVDEDLYVWLFDTICFDAEKDIMKLMLRNVEIFSSKECYWFSITFRTKYIKENKGMDIGIVPETVQIQYPKEIWEDVETAIEIYNIEDIFIKVNHPKLNYDF